MVYTIRRGKYVKIKLILLDMCAIVAVGMMYVVASFMNH